MKPPKSLCTYALFFLLAALSASAQNITDFRVPFPRPRKVVTDTVEVFIIGDVMMHERQLSYDCSEFLKRIKPAIQKADIAVANMEFSLGGEPYSGYPCFSAPDSYAKYVRDCGTDVFLMANNHILDRGESGLQRTLSVYDTLGVKYAGAAAREEADTLANPLIVRCKGLTLAFLNFTYGTNNPQRAEWPAVNRFRKEALHGQIQRARNRGADYIVALPHWGTEYALTHSKTQEEWAEWLVSEGVDIIVGAHPHVVQDTTHINGVPVIYSVGNAVSNMSAENTRLELAVTLRFTRDNWSGETGMMEPELRFMWCTLPGRLIDNYTTIFTKEWATRRTEWLIPSDFDNMIATLERVKAATGIED